MNKICKFCGKEFEAKRCNQKFCSNKCGQKWSRQERIRKWREYACKKKHGGCESCNEPDCVMGWEA